MARRIGGGVALRIRTVLEKTGKTNRAVQDTDVRAQADAAGKEPARPAASALPAPNPVPDMRGAAVAEKLEGMNLSKEAGIVREGVAETVSHYEFPPDHWRCIRTNDPPERLMREIRRRSVIPPWAE